MKDDKLKRNVIYGLMMRPVSTTAEENKEVMMSTAVSIREKFFERYSSLIAEMQIVAECAKIYIDENWQKVKDWSDLEIVMEDANTLDDYVEYYNYKEKSTSILSNSKSDFLKNFRKRTEERNKARHNPVVSVTDVVLDPSDGDFSLTVNGRVHMWISDATVIILSKFVEDQIKKEANKMHVYECINKHVLNIGIGTVGNVAIPRMIVCPICKADSPHRHISEGTHIVAEYEWARFNSKRDVKNAMIEAYGSHFTDAEYDEMKINTKIMFKKVKTEYRLG